MFVLFFFVKGARLALLCFRGHQEAFTAFTPSLHLTSCHNQKLCEEIQEPTCTAIAEQPSCRQTTHPQGSKTKAVDFLQKAAPIEEVLLLQTAILNFLTVQGYKSRDGNSLYLCQLMFDLYSECLKIQ